MFNIIEIDRAVKIDCIVRKNREFERLKFSQRRRAKINDLEFWTIKKEDLIISKLTWSIESFSEMQMEDIVNLADTGYDSTYVKLWIDKLNLHEIWQKVEEWKIRRQK